MKDVLMITHFTQTPGEAGNARFAYLADLLAETFNVEVITTDFSHRTKEKRNLNLDDLEELKYNLTLLKEPGYKKNVSLKRFYSHWQFGKSLKKYLKKRRKPDLVYCSIPSLDVGNVVTKYVKKYSIPLIIDVQDLWPEAFRMIVDIPLISDIVFCPMNIKANKLYKQADAIIAVSNTYMTRAKKSNIKSKMDEVIFLGTDLKNFDMIMQNSKEIKNKDDFTIGYVGTLGHSYDIKLVIDAIELLYKKGYKNIKFWVMGDGPLEEKFKVYAKEKNVSVRFFGRLDYSIMVQKLGVCDITVNPIVSGSAGSIINKHADYAASGLPVLNTQESEEYRMLVENYQMGFNCENGNVQDLAGKIKLLIDNKDLRKKLGNNSRKCAEQLFDREITYNRIVNVINKL